MSSVFLISLFGCGGSTNGGVDSTTAAPPNTINVVPTVQSTNNVPDIPTGVVAVGGVNKVTISWNPVSGAASYIIYWSTFPEVTATKATGIASTATTYIHRGLLPAATYYYAVTAHNDTGESSAMGRLSATTADMDGAAPYVIYCEDCHGQLATSYVTSVSVDEIKAAMQNFSAMNTLSLSDPIIAAISAALMLDK